MNTKVRIQLSVMMFLQYVIWASWYVTMGRYLGGTLNFTPQQIGIAYNSTALAAMISPFFVGMVADRFFATEKVLSVLHFLSGALILAASQQTTFGAFYPLLIAHTLCYMPTLALTNSISFHQMKDPGKEFPGIRVLGTISWIVTVWGVGRLSPLDITSPWPFRIAGVASMVMGLYCLLLPHTPPKTKGQKVTVKDVLGLDALQLLKERSFAIFVVSAFLICIPLSFYFSFAPTFFGDMDMPDATGKTVYGQISEIFFMLVMPFFFARLGVKWMLMVGMLSWSARYFLFLLGYNTALLWPLYLGIILHGICYDFFFVTAYIYVDKKAPETIRAKAQGFIAFVTLGAGMFVGTSLSGLVAQSYSFPKAEPARFQIVQDASVWSEGNFAKWDANNAPAFGRIKQIVKDGSAVPGVSERVIGTTNNPAARLELFKRSESGYLPSGEIVVRPLKDLSRPLSLWDKIWTLPAVGALIILVLFAVMFQYKEESSASDKRA